VAPTGAEDDPSRSTRRRRTGVGEPDTWTYPPSFSSKPRQPGQALLASPVLHPGLTDAPNWKFPSRRARDARRRYYNTVRPHRALNRSTPAEAYTARPKAKPAKRLVSGHYRVRRDRVDTGGVITIRYDSRLRTTSASAENAAASASSPSPPTATSASSTPRPANSSASSPSTPARTTSHEPRNEGTADPRFRRSAVRDVL